MKPSIWYEITICGRLTVFLSCLGIPTYIVLMRLFWGRYDELSPDMVLQTFVILLPLVSGLAAAHLMSIESEVGFSELRLTYPEPRFKLPVLRTIMAMVLILLSMILGVIMFVWLWGLPNFNLLPCLLPAIFPAIFLSGLSMLINGFSHSYWVAAASVMGWWFFELQTRGQITGVMFLFHTIWPNAGISTEVNQAFLAVVGLGLLILNIFLYASQVKRGTIAHGLRTG
jgi:ABC-type transport system involved in multi-copper enzyme maturation permease subunit